MKLGSGMAIARRLAEIPSANNNILEGMGPLHESSGWKEITPEIIEGGEFN